MFIPWGFPIARFDSKRVVLRFITFTHTHRSCFLVLQLGKSTTRNGRWKLHGWNGYRSWSSTQPVTSANMAKNDAIWQAAKENGQCHGCHAMFSKNGPPVARQNGLVTEVPTNTVHVDSWPSIGIGLAASQKCYVFLLNLSFVEGNWGCWWVNFAQQSVGFVNDRIGQNQIVCERCRRKNMWL